MIEALLWIGGVIFILVLLVGLFSTDSAEAKKLESSSKIVTFSTSDRLIYGEVSRNMICPHCQRKGMVMTKPVKIKAGVSGAKAGIGLMTGGVSLLATGLSSKKNQTQAHCKNCSTTWIF